MSKETFKEFVRLKPELIKQVNSNKTSWQKLYEIYEIYGDIGVLIIRRSI